MANGFQKKAQKTPINEIERALRIKKEYENEKNNLTTLDELTEKHFGKRGTKKREKFERGFEAFKLGVLLKQAREERGLTQAEVARKCGTTKSYISKLENDIKEVRISTLQKIVELGLGGHLELSIRL